MKESDMFHSFDEFLLALKLHEVEHREQYWMRDCKTLKNANRLRSKFAPPELKYYYIRYSCIHGGQEFRKRENRTKRSLGTWKQGCGADIRLGLSHDCQALIVHKINSLHNHEIPSKESYKQLPVNRKFKHRINVPFTDETDDIFSKSSNVETLGKKATLNDLATFGKAPSEHEINHFVKILEEQHECIVDVNIRRDSFSALFLQDQRMRDNFREFPEIIFIDGAHKSMKLNAPIYTLAVENAIGQTEIVGIAMLAAYSTGNFNWMMNRFKERNGEWKNVKVIFLENDTTDTLTLQDIFPSSRLILCPDQYMRHFKDVISKQLLLSDTELSSSLSYLRRIFSAKCLKDHDRVFKEFSNLVPARLHPYISSGWHDYRYDWLIKNNRLDGFYLKLKALITTNTPMVDFFNLFFKVLNIKRVEYQNEITKINLKIPTTQYTDESDECFYARLLTKYAFEHLEKQLKGLDSAQFIMDDNGNIVCETANKEKIVLTETTCQCEFFTTMKLPCKHLFHYRRTLFLPIYDRSLCANRWTRSHLDNSTVTTSTAEEEFLPYIILGVEDKYKKAIEICARMAKQCSEVSDKVFDERIALLSFIEKQWRIKEIGMLALAHTSNNVAPEIEQFATLTDDLYVPSDEYLQM